MYWLTGLLLLCFISGVFAQWTQELTVHNEFKTARYDTVLEEEFQSPNQWKPGEEINKDVWIKNNGTVPIFAKVMLHQEWTRKNNGTDEWEGAAAQAAGEGCPLSFGDGKEKEYAAQIHWSDQVVLLESGKVSDIDLGLPTVKKLVDAKNKWLLVTDQPDGDGNYTFYYMGMIGPNEKTPLLLDGVTMNKKIEPAILKTRTFYDSETEKWVTQYESNQNCDYERANYKLVVTSTTVQATENAAKAIYNTEKDVTEIVAYLSESLSTSSSNIKKLYFKEKNGKMTWNPVRGNNGNWFMSFTNMVPGEEYQDGLEIKNESQKTYQLYMQVITNTQDTKRDQLLEMISVKVSQDAKMLYKGTASGKEYEDGNLQNVIYLGTYEPGDCSKIIVDLSLRDDVGLEYNEILTKNDWKFMVTEKGNTGKEVQELQRPKTGDWTNLSFYLCMTAGSGIAIILLLLKKRKERKRESWDTEKI